MAANTNPTFPLTPNAGSFASLTTANTAEDGTGTVSTIFTGGTNGSIATKLVIQPQGTNVATVARFFLNNGSTNATAGNNSHFLDVTIAATTASNTAALSNQVIDLSSYGNRGGLEVPNGYKINVVIATAVSAGIAFTALGMDF